MGYYTSGPQANNGSRQYVGHTLQHIQCEPGGCVSIDDNASPPPCVAKVDTSPASDEPVNEQPRSSQFVQVGFVDQPLSPESLYESNEKDLDEKDVPSTSPDDLVSGSLGRFDDSFTSPKGASFSHSGSGQDLALGADDRDSLALNAMISFEGEDDMLRGINLNQVMSWCATLFATSKGSSSSFALSRGVTRIKYFLSHNWAVPRVNKAVALCFHFNFDMAAVLCILLAGMLIYFSWSGDLPTIPLHRDQATRGGVLGQLGLLPVFFILAFTIHDFLGLMGYGGPPVFLDKACIDQVDEEMKRKAIEKIGAFIDSSDEMVVLYTDLYLQKLWTCYEVGSFLTLHPVQKMTVIPVARYMALCVSASLIYIWNIALVLCKTQNDAYPLSYLFAIGAGAAYLCVLRRWAKERKVMLDRLRRFSIRDCHCELEIDRTLVYGNIRTLMAVSRGEDISEEKAIHLFDEMIRDRLPAALAETCGRFTFRYKHYCLLGCVYNLGWGIDSWCAVKDNNLPPRIVGAWCLYALWLCTVLWPVVWMLAEVLAGQFVHLTGWKQACWMIFAFITCEVIPVISADVLVRSLVRLATHETVGMIMLIFLVLLAPLIPITFGSARCWRRWSQVV